MQPEQLESRVNAIAEALAAVGGQRCQVAVVLGSGLGPFADRLSDAVELPFEAIDELPKSTVPGHAGRFVIGELGGARVLVQSGRVHLYEGWSAREVSLAARAFGRLGLGALVLTNAAGGLRAEWAPGSLMLVRDHLNLQGETPLGPAEAGHGSPWDQEMADLMLQVGREEGIALREGVYAGLLGPSYETPAEVRALGWMGADAVGMSTVAEALAGSAEGLRVTGVSCITNLAAGLSGEVLSHEEVIEVGRAASARFSRLLEVALPRLAALAPRRR